MASGGVTPFLPFADTVLFKILAPEHRGLSSGKRLHKGNTAWDTGIWLGRSETNTEHIVRTRNDDNNPKAGTGETFRNFVVAREGVPWSLVPNAPRRGRRKRHLTPATAPPPAHENPIDDKSSSSSDSSSSSSSSPQAPSGIPQHVNDQAPAQTNSRSQPQTVVDCVADADSESSDQVVYTDQASSRARDTGRASTGKASAR